MKIKCTLGDNHVVITPEWLLEKFEEELIEEIVCNGCHMRGQSLPESYEPMCFSECIDSFIEENENEEIRFEVLNERV